MLGVTIIALGKLKEKYLRDACDEYIKRLGTLCKLKIWELDPVKLGDNASQTEIDKALEKEGKEIFAKIPQGAKVIAMCIEGKQMPVASPMEVSLHRTRCEILYAMLLNDISMLFRR